MHIWFLGRDEKEELKMLFPRALIIDLCIYLITLPLYGFGLEIPLGLLLGTAACFVNLIILGYACAGTVERPVKQAKRYMFMWYLIRMAILGVFIVIGFKVPFINSVCVCLPLFYPKIIYTAKSFKSDGNKERRTR